jgi:CRP/FNR family cyclic AMP-dependent transcriptional regulator
LLLSSDTPVRAHRFVFPVESAVAYWWQWVFLFLASDKGDVHPMRKILFILAEFTDQDLDWIAGTGTREFISRGQVLVTEGKRIEVLYITLEGKLAVTTKGSGTIAELGAGEIVGELSFLDSRPPNASVLALEDSTVLSIPVSRLHAKLKSDLGFSSRFYRALGVLLSHRLRDTVIQLAYGVERRLDEDVEEAGELSPELLDNLNLAAARFEAILRKLEVV